MRSGSGDDEDEDDDNDAAAADSGGYNGLNTTCAKASVRRDGLSSVRYDRFPEQVWVWEVIFAA